MNAEQVIRNDLDLIVENLAIEFSAMSGRNLMIACGAGFLGYYLEAMESSQCVCL